MNIAVYLGASEGDSPVYKEAARALGQWLGANGHRLIYGGSKTGLMGVLARHALESGGEVIGVEPRIFIEAEYQMEGLTELIVTKDMRERKATMMALADAFVVFPGGTGTAEEIAEVVSAGSLGLISGIYGYYNLDGYYDFAKSGYDQMVSHGFLSQAKRDKIRFWNSIDEIAADLC